MDEMHFWFSASSFENVVVYSLLYPISVRTAGL